MELVDAHCHFDFPVFDGQREAIRRRAAALGVTRIVIPGVRRPDWFRVSETAQALAGGYYCLGIHPWFVDEHGSADLDALKATLMSRPSRCVALGECGLDRLHGQLERQMPWFEAQVDIARDAVMPLVVHSVRAHDEVASVLRRKQFSHPVLIHGYSGSLQQAKKLIDLGCFIGVGGVITHERARKTRETIAALPLAALVLETDAPDMAPAGVMKGGNSPEFLGTILQALSGLRPESVDELKASLWDNACSLYRW
ncbi:TatD family hydrolase [Marinobacter caseinilyticus]|uniref:TatD family hydrolase n=1 Tax=Marinobacter caseinilyticus TaxID=2692195 RepID=UPI0014076A1F|nr:TatD family hydrolase [Marinobacter caseinilyticus]